MKEGTDYTIAITGNNAPGYMEITVTFCGNYEGSYEKYIYLANGMADLDNEGNETEEPVRPYDPNKPDKPDNSEPDPTGVGSDGSEADSRKDTSDDPDTDTAAENGDSIDTDDPGTGTGKHGKNRQNGKNRDLSSKARAVATSKGKIVKVKGKKKTFSLRWKKVKNAAGYEIQYARNKKFTKKAVTVTASSKKKGIVIRKLKAKKKYYVRVRAYTIENGVRICGKWSKAKKVKTK